MPHDPVRVADPRAWLAKAGDASRPRSDFLQMRCLVELSFTVSKPQKKE